MSDRDSLALPQPHTRLLAVRELDAGGLESGADSVDGAFAQRFLTRFIDGLIELDAAASGDDRALARGDEART